MTEYELGFERGMINAPRSEHYESPDGDEWLRGYDDGLELWDGKTGFKS